MDLLNFDFFEKDLGLASLPNFLLCDFSKKIFVLLYFINLPNIIPCLSLRLEELGNIFIVIIYFLACDVIDFEIDLKFLIKPFSHMTKKVGTKI